MSEIETLASDLSESNMRSRHACQMRRKILVQDTKGWVTSNIRLRYMCELCVWLDRIKTIYHILHDLYFSSQIPYKTSRSSKTMPTFNQQNGDVVLKKRGSSSGSIKPHIEGIIQNMFIIFFIFIKQI